MTEKEIQLLGFEKQVEEGLPSPKSPLTNEHSFYYYTLDIANGLSFISNSSDEVEEDAFGWYIEFFDTEPAIRYTNFGEATGLINNLLRHVVRK